MLDPLLHRFVETADAAEAERELSAIIEQHAVPLAQAIVARRLRTYGDDRPGRADAADREDVVGDALATLVERLRLARADAASPPIENFNSYAAVVVHSTCAHFIRCRYPERARLKHRLRYVLSTDPRLALWKTDQGDLACGLAQWRGHPVESVADQRIRALLNRSDSRWTSGPADLTAAVVEVATAADGPVDFETFVAVAAARASLAEPRTADSASLVSAAPDYEIAIDQRRFLYRVWNEVTELPVRQRAALLLNLRDAMGAGLLWLLPIAGIASVRHIARVLEISDADFANLWRELPLDDAAIGRRLGCTRQQVINLRMTARKRLLRRVASSGSGTTRHNQDRRGNLNEVSASLGGRA